MRIRKLTNELNVVSEIDELIMELTYLKNGNTSSINKLQKGVEIINHVITLSEKPKEKMMDEKFGFNPFHNRRYVYSGKYNIEDYKVQLEMARESIYEFMNSPTNANKNDIEKIQELLLKISVPIWKQEVSILKPNQLKSN